MNTASNLPISLEGKTPEEMREKIFALEALLLTLPKHDPGFKLTHHFCGGVYMRELFIPKGTVLTGKIHLTEHLNVLAQGDITVWTDEGMKRLKASTVIKSKPGIKRVGFAHEDSVWITVHKTDETDPDVIEATITTNDPEIYKKLTEDKHLCLS